MCVWQITVQAVHSQNIRLALSLGQKNTADVATAYANLDTLKDDIAIFSYKVPKPLITTNGRFYVSDLRISAIRHRSLIRTATKIMIEILSVMMGGTFV